MRAADQRRHGEIIAMMRDPQRSIREVLTRLSGGDGAPFGDQTNDDMRKEPVAVTGSIVSDPATHPADQITDRWPTRVDTRRAAAEATQGPEPVRQSSVAASAPAANDHLSVGGVLAIFAAGLVLASIAARFVFKLSKVLPI